MNIATKLRRIAQDIFSNLKTSDYRDMHEIANKIDELIAERDALKARIDGGIRVKAIEYHDQFIGKNILCKPRSEIKNAILILDEGVKL